MPVDQFGRANPIFSHKPSQPGKGQFRALRLRSSWNEHSLLDRTWTCRFDMKKNLRDRCGRGLRFKVELQKLHQKCGVHRGHRQLQCAYEDPLGCGCTVRSEIEMQPEMEFAGCKSTSGQPKDKLTEETVKHKGKRFEVFDRVIEFHLLFKSLYRKRGDRMRVDSP